MKNKRGSIYADPHDNFLAVNGVVYGYIQTEIEDENERRIIKILGDSHSSKNPKAGRYYGVGLTVGDGSGVLEKEYPEHPKPPSS